MDLPGEIIKSVVDSRSFLGSPPQTNGPVDGLTLTPTTASPTEISEKSNCAEVPEMTIQQAEHILSFGLPIAIHIVLVHENCKLSDPSECPGSRQVEVWTVRRQKVVNDGPGQPILPLFLKQAIRSQLHFSPVNSWVMHNNHQFPRGIRCSYRLSTSSHFHVDSNDGSIQLEKHRFPSCKLGNDEFLTIEVKWIRKNGFPDMPNICPSVRVEESVEWILGSPSSSPVGCITPHEFPSQCPSPLSTSPRNSATFVYTTNNSNTCTSNPSFNDTNTGTNEKTPSDGKIETGDTKSTVTATEVEVLSEFLAVSPISTTTLRTSSTGASRPSASENLMEKHGSKHQQQKVFRKSPPSSSTIQSPGQSHTSSNMVTRRSRARRNTTGSVLSADKEDNEDTPTTKQPLRMRPSTSFCGSMVFNPKTRLPMNSSPAPLKRSPQNLATKLRERLAVDDSSSSDSECITGNSKIYGNNHSHTGLVCNFEESALNGRLEPVATIDGFKLQIAVHGAFSVPHVMLPVTTFFFDVCDDATPSLYLGHCSLDDFHRKAFHIPKKCTVQATLFNPQGSVVKIFIVKVDVSDMPPKSKTFVRQRTYCMPETMGIEEAQGSWLKYLIHLRLATDRSGKLYLHTDIRMLFSNKTDVDVLNLMAATKNLGGRATPVKEEYKLMSSTEMPQRPKYSPTK